MFKHNLFYDKFLVFAITWHLSSSVCRPKLKNKSSCRKPLGQFKSKGGLNHPKGVCFFIGWYCQTSNMAGRSWSYGSWIYNYLCNQCPSPQTLSSNPAQVRHTQYNIMWSSLSATCGRPVVFYTNKTDWHETILLKVALNTTILAL
jgi:hypothetical protein